MVPMDKHKSKRLKQLLDLVIILTKKEIKVRYKGNILGYLWSVAHPLSFAIVFYIAFKIVMKVPMENYTMFLLAGLFPWQWINNSVGGGCSIFLANSSLIKKVNFSRNIVVSVYVLQELVNFLFTIPILIGFLMFYEIPLTWTLLYGIPVFLVVQFVNCYGFALLVASLNIFFRDMSRLVELFVMLLFYLTPILYPLSMIPERFRTWLFLNPFSHLIMGWREVLMEGNLNFSYLGIAIIHAIIILVLGTTFYRLLNHRFAEVL